MRYSVSVMVLIRFIVSYKGYYFSFYCKRKNWEPLYNHIIIQFQQSFIEVCVLLISFMKAVSFFYPGKQ